MTAPRCWEPLLDQWRYLISGGTTVIILSFWDSRVGSDLPLAEKAAGKTGAGSRRRWLSLMNGEKESWRVAEETRDSLGNWLFSPKDKPCKGTVKSEWKVPWAEGTEIELLHLAWVSYFPKWSPKVRINAHKQEISFCYCLYTKASLSRVKIICPEEIKYLLLHYSPLSFSRLLPELLDIFLPYGLFGLRERCILTSVTERTMYTCPKGMVLHGHTSTWETLLQTVD